MNLEEVVIPLSYLQRAFLLAALEYDRQTRRFHLGKWQWLFAIPQACISISLLWIAIDETVRTTNLISFIRNANIWMEALLSIIYNIHNTHIEWRLGSRVLCDLLSFNDRVGEEEPEAGGERAQRICNDNAADDDGRSWRRNKKTLRAVAICAAANALGILQSLAASRTIADAFRRLLIEMPNFMDNILVTKWCVYLFALAECNKQFVDDMHKCMANWNRAKWLAIRRRYSRLYLVYRQIVECFASFLLVFLVSQYMRLLWMLYVLAERLILGGRFAFHTLYEVVVQIFTFYCIVLPCLRMRGIVNAIGSVCSRVYGDDKKTVSRLEAAAHLDVLNFQLQILVQDFNVRPHGAVELNGTLITAIFSSLLVYIVLLIQIARL